MGKKDRQNRKVITIQNSFQQPGVETPIDRDLSSKWARAEIVLKFLEEKERNAR
jgi:hypothetical protein